MSAITLPAHFDGERIRLDDPYELEPDNKILVTVLPKEQEDEEHEAWFRLSSEGLARAYGEEEADYPTELIREPNLERLSHRKPLSLDHPEKNQRRSL